MRLQGDWQHYASVRQTRLHCTALLHVLFTTMRLQGDRQHYASQPQTVVQAYLRRPPLASTPVRSSSVIALMCYILCSLPCGACRGTGSITPASRRRWCKRT
jgi:hypothetical protein